jgi:predicted aldo/keto reductase-like oxidoreductase
LCETYCTSSDETSRQRYTKEAIGTLEKAVKQGYRDVVYLTTEVDLDPVRTQEGFGRVLEALRRSAGNSSVSEGKYY